MGQSLREPAKRKGIRDSRPRGLKVVKRALPLVMAFYFVSGACSLMDEVIWVRLLKLTLGNTVYASSVVVSVFMGGLALGAVIASRIADRVRNHLRLYSILEAMVAISTLALPLGLWLADAGYVAFYRVVGRSDGALLAAQVVVSSLLLLVPTMLMGSTLPILGSYVTSLESEAGKLVGRLYALNMLGAAAGCFLAGFVLIPIVGVMGVLYLAGALNAVIALWTWMLSRSHPADDIPVRDVSKLSVEEGSQNGQVAFGLFVSVFFVSGLVSIGYELLWMRSVVFLMGGTTYVFSAVLTIYLLGNFAGAAIGSWLAPRVPSPAAVYSLIVVLLGATGIAYLPWLTWLAGDFLPFATANDTAEILLTRPLYQSLVLFVLPSLLMGAGFPIALQAWAKHAHLIGRSTGMAYAANTIGAVAGGIITGFILIPLLGVQASILMLSVVAVLLGAASGIATLWPYRRREIACFCALAIGSIAAAIAIPNGLFRHMVESKVAHQSALLELVDVREGTTTTVSTHRHIQDGSLRLYSSGEDVAGDSYSHRGDQKALGHLAMLLHPNPKKVLSVGFGSGETTKCLSLHRPDVLDCVEIAPEVVQVALANFQHINLGDQLSEKVNMVYMDAKNYLHLSDQTYDVIVNDSIHPRVFAENASLYGKEYFEAAKARLNPGGILVSWIPTYQMPYSAFDSIYGTAMQVFPHVTIWYPSSNPAPLVLLVCSSDTQQYSLSHTEQTLMVPEIRISLALIGIEQPADFLSWFVCDEQSLRQHVTNFNVNGDYSPFIEFTTDPAPGDGAISEQFVVRVRSPFESLAEHLDWSGVDPDEQPQLLVQIRNSWDAATFIVKASGTLDRLTRLKILAQGLYESPEKRVLKKVRDVVQEELLAVGMLELNSGKREDALSMASSMQKVDANSGAAHALLSRYLLGSGNMPLAVRAAREGVQHDGDNPAALSALAYVLTETNQFGEAAKLARHALEIDPQYLDALTVLTRIKMTKESGAEFDPEEAVVFAKRACEARGYLLPQHLLLLAEALSRAGHVAPARKYAKMARDRGLVLGVEGVVKQAEQQLAIYESLRQ